MKENLLKIVVGQADTLGGFTSHGVPFWSNYKLRQVDLLGLYYMKGHNDVSVGRWP